MQENSDSPLGGPLEMPEDTTQQQPTYPTQKPKKKAGKIIAVVLVVIILLGVIGFVIWKFARPDNSTEPSTASTGPTTTEAETTKPSYTAAPGTKTYTNSRMRLTLSYPDNWTVTENNNAVKIESPDFAYTTMAGEEITGNFRIYIRQGATEAESKTFGRGYAVEASEKLVYAQPTSNQRKETLLSNFGLDEPNNFAYFLVAGNFDLKKGETLGPGFGKEADTLIIAGGYSAKELPDGLSTNQVPLDDYKASTAYKQAVDILKSIQVQ